MPMLQQLVEEDFGYESGSGYWGRAKAHDSLVVNESKQIWFWNSRGIRGSVLDYLILVRGLAKHDALEYIKIGGALLSEEDTTEHVSEPYDKLIELFWRDGKNNREYWHKRCLTNSTIDKYRLGFFNGWYFIPLYSDGDFINFQCRRDYPAKRINSWYKGKPKILFNDGILPFVDTVYVVEGTVDSILLSQEGFPSVSTMGANVWNNEWNNKFTHIRNIYYIEDNDKAGREGARIVSKALGADRVKIVSYEDKDPKYDTVDFFRENKSSDLLKSHIESSAKFLYEIEYTKGYNARVNFRRRK